ANGEDAAALLAIGQPAERQTDDRIQEGEHGAEQSERGIAQGPLAADAFRDAADDLAVEEVHQVDREQHDERVDGPWSHESPFFHWQALTTSRTGVCGPR